MASPEVAATLGKEFVSVKIDWDRMPGARQLLQPSGGKSPGLPWFAFLDGDGKVLIDSIAPAPLGNVGFPAKAEEYAHFKTMLEKVRRRLTDDDIAKLLRVMEQVNAKT